LIRTISVAIDLSESSEDVITSAAAIAKACDARVLLLHAVAPSPDFVGYEVGPQYIRDAYAKELREQHSKLRRLSERLARDGVECDAFLLQGPTAKKILEFSLEKDVDLLVVGSHGYNPLARLALGSISTEILRGTRIPIVVVPIGRQDSTY
jgi:nucleotide-binding universal stress UspA family protein